MDICDKQKDIQADRAKMINKIDTIKIKISLILVITIFITIFSLSTSLFHIASTYTHSSIVIHTAVHEKQTNKQ